MHNTEMIGKSLGISKKMKILDILGKFWNFLWALLPYQTAFGHLEGAPAPWLRPWAEVPGLIVQLTASPKGEVLMWD